MILLCIYALGFFIAWPIFSKWYMADKYPKIKDRTTERYADSIIIGFLLSFIWPPIFWVAVALGITWVIGAKILMPLFFPETRKKKAKKSE